MSNVVVVENKDDFQNEVINTEGPVLVDFWAEWCGPCKQLAPLVEDASEEFKDKIKVCKMDVDANRETAAEYGIRSIPTLMIFENGELVGTEIGALSKLQLEEFIRSKIYFYTYIFAYFKKRVIISYPELIKPSIYTISN